MITYLDTSLITTSEVMDITGWRLSNKMVDYLRTRIGLLPDGLRLSEGKQGVTIYYPQKEFIPYWTHIMQAKEKGHTCPEMMVMFQKERNDLSNKNDYLRYQHLLEKEIMPKTLIHLQKDTLSAQSSFCPDIVISNKGGIVFVVEAKRALVYEIKSDLEKWDGKSIEALHSIKQKIEKVENLQARERVLKTVNP
jgi:hypothetical protein